MKELHETGGVSERTAAGVFFHSLGTFFWRAEPRRRRKDEMTLCEKPKKKKLTIITKLCSSQSGFSESHLHELPIGTIGRPS